MPEGRAAHNEIAVTTRLEGERVVVEVRDTGAGIRPEINKRIFDPFFTTKAVGVGTGLGLAICHRIVTDMGGELTVESEVGKGSTFRVALPLARKEEPEAIPQRRTDALAARRGNILVVDDEPLIVRGISSPATRLSATVLINRKATSDSRATIHSFLSQTENAGEAGFGLALAGLTAATSTTTTLMCSACLFLVAGRIVKRTKAPPPI